MHNNKLQTVLGLALVVALFGSALAQPSPAALAAAAVPTGFLDVANNTIALGWTCVPTQPFRPLFVQIFVDNNLVGTVLANNNRPDVASSCGGNGFHGFSFTFPASVQATLSNGQPHTVSAFTRQTIEGIPRTQLNNSPRTVQVTNTAPRGFLDTASITSATGWACDPNNFNTPLRVDFYIDNNVFAGSTTANLPRETAVGQQCGGNPNHGFSFTFPANIQAILNNGQPHTVRAFAINIPTGSNPELSGSPKTVQGTRVPPTPTPTPPPQNQPPRGFLDTATRTSASGWACDPDNFNVPLRVDIYVNNNVFAGSTTANLPREAAVGQQCGGNPNHGWTFTFPANIQALLANGGTVQAFAINTPTGNNPQLSGSPKTV